MRASVAVAASEAIEDSDRDWSRELDESTLCPNIARISFSVFIGVLENLGLRLSSVAFCRIRLMTTLLPSES